MWAEGVLVSDWYGNGSGEVGVMYAYDTNDLRWIYGTSRQRFMEFGK